MRKSKTDILEKVGGLREERLTLAEKRAHLYENFIKNIRLLRAETGMSAVELAKESGIASGTRILNLEYGRGTPETEEIILYSKFFKSTMDDILYKTATIIFK